MSMLTDGFKTLISFALAPGIELFEIEVTPPGLDALGKIDITTMHNTRWRTSVGKALVTATDMQFTAAYDPVMYVDILAILGIAGIVSVTFPDGSHLEFTGSLDKFQPGMLKEGDRPTAACTIIIHNQTVLGAEEAITYFAP